MRKLIATLFAAICLITAFGQVDSLKNASLIGQSSRNQKVGQGFQIGFVGSSDDTCQINTKLQIVPNAGEGKVLTSDANGFAYWTNSSSVDTFSGTPVFPSGIITDTVFTTGGATGQVLILVNDTTGVFANAPFVDTIYRLTGKDSIFYVIDGRTHAIKDSIGGGGGLSVWDTSGNNIYNNNSGNVGIGTTTPAYKFQAIDGGSEIKFDSTVIQFNALGPTTNGTTITLTPYYVNMYAPQTVGWEANYLQFSHNGLIINHIDTVTGSGTASTIEQISDGREALKIRGESNANIGVSVIGHSGGNLEKGLSLTGSNFSNIGVAATYIGGSAGGMGSIKDIEIYPTNGALYLSNISAGAGKVLSDVNGSGKAEWRPSSTTPLDSATIYTLTPDNGTQYYCTDCSGNGITGRIVAFIGAAWRRLTFED